MTVEIQDQRLRGIQATPERLRLEMAVGFFASEEMTLGQAAELAEISQSQFLRELGRRGVCVHYGTEEFEQDLRTIELLRRS